MENARAKTRFVVSNLGFGFAVHDTQAKAEYAHRAGQGKEHASNNVLNSERVEIFSTRGQAQAHADELNRKVGGSA